MARHLGRRSEGSVDGAISLSHSSRSARSLKTPLGHTMISRLPRDINGQLPHVSLSMKSSKVPRQPKAGAVALPVVLTIGHSNRPLNVDQGDQSLVMSAVPPHVRGCHRYGSAWLSCGDQGGRADTNGNWGKESLSHFARPFKATTGQSPHQSLIARRVERAQQLLEGKGRLSLVEVALRVGFLNQSQFSRPGSAPRR